MLRLSCLLLFVGASWAAPACAESVLVEAESFDSHGGWSLDTQSITAMGSPYLLAHGLGRPVQDATTTVSFPAEGTYRVFVRTKDWVARWNAPGQPGRFQLILDGHPLEETFGTTGADWFWHDGGTVEVKSSARSQPGMGIKVQLALHDLTGFDGRCDAVYFTTASEPPPNEGQILPKWRQQALGLGEEPTQKADYDLVVVGGGYSGMGAALAAARAGCKVALIQDRGVLGGNGSSEVRVWAMGNIRRGKYPRIGEIVEEFCDHAKKSPGTFEEFEDAKKEAIVRAEENIDLFLDTHAYAVDMEDVANPGSATQGRQRQDGSKSPNSQLSTLNAQRHIAAIHAFNVRTSEQYRFAGRLFCDATGHGTIGFLAQADWDMTPEGRMGMSNMWAWGEGEQTVNFPETPWALSMTMADFPYPRDHHGQWFWESGYNKDPMNDAEGIRDHNLRAVFGAWNAMKNGDGAAEHKTAFLTW
ncbi:MAG: FAD-dependent oxidoreductase, partial [Planctomycetaceae bacterium]|nr:FAD-dependent oxidoreductase [Planctomycetaceae bacterium]